MVWLLCSASLMYCTAMLQKSQPMLLLLLLLLPAAAAAAARLPLACLSFRRGSWLYLIRQIIDEGGGAGRGSGSRWCSS
jgi:hypothetical protein